MENISVKIDEKLRDEMRIEFTRQRTSKVYFENRAYKILDDILFPTFRLCGEPLWFYRNLKKDLDEKHYILYKL
jgi:hypothetical protein